VRTPDLGLVAKPYLTTVRWTPTFAARKGPPAVQAATSHQQASAVGAELSEGGAQAEQGELHAMRRREAAGAASPQSGRWQRVRRGVGRAQGAGDLARAGASLPAAVSTSDDAARGAETTLRTIVVVLSVRLPRCEHGGSLRRVPEWGPPSRVRPSALGMVLTLQLYPLAHSCTPLTPPGA